MPLGSRLASLFRTLLRKSRLDRELDEEVQGYLEELVAQRRQRGLTPEEARRDALLDMGGLEQVREKVRGVRIGNGVETTLRDLHLAWRMIRRSPSFALVVTLTLALGIGANVTMFSVIHAVLWRPLPYPDPDRLVILNVDTKGVVNAGAAPGEVLDLRAQSRLVDHLSTFSGVDAHVYVDHEAERVAAASVSDDVLPLLGAIPALGRTLRARQDVGEKVRSVVISDGLWRRRFKSDPAVLGRRVQINELNVEVVGILRPDFRTFLPPAFNAAEEIDVWFPTGIEDTREDRGYAVVGRLKPGVTLAQAQAEFDGLAARFVEDHPETYPDGTLRLALHPLRQALTDDVGPALAALSGAVGFVLLIACVNVANLMLARGSTRKRELAIRRALGASGARLVRQGLTESLVLGAIGGAAGLLAGYLGLELVDWLRPAHLPRESQISVDGTVVLYAVGLSVATSLLFGLLPAMRLASDHGHERLKAGRSETASPGTRRLQRALVVAEVALSIVPLVAAGLMLRTFVNLTHAPIGFDPSNLLTATAPSSSDIWGDVEQSWAFYRDVLDRVRRLAGVEAVSAAHPLPFGAWQVTRRYGRDGDLDTPLSLGTQQTVMPGYLRLVGTALREGRDFTTADIDAQRPVVIVDERLARRLWPGGALGEQLIVQVGQRREVLEVIGVTNAVRMTQVRDDDTPHFFVPYHFFPIQMSLVVKTTESDDAIGPTIESTIESLGTGRAVFDIRPMADYVTDSVSDTRFTLLVLVGFASASLLLAAFGLYGTLAYLISQRSQELGVRMALGATAGRVVGMVVREGAALAAVGAAIGLAGALAITRTLRSLLYGVTPFDSATIVSVAGVVTLAAVVAAAHPAWRAARIDPSTTLRSE
ncbi:MAG: FtsX-like permease family protein [Luteitalea sp.]|nr:FtsX-like permease family protein [Luteitalea sp.]